VRGISTGGLDGSEAVPAHVDLSLLRRVGRCGVDIWVFDAFMRRLDTRGDRRVLRIDEIGKMECFSHTFRGLIHHWPDGPAPVVATVAENGRPDPPRQALVRLRLHILQRPTAGLLADRLELWARA